MSIIKVENGVPYEIADLSVQADLTQTNNLAKDFVKGKQVLKTFMPKIVEVTTAFVLEEDEPRVDWGEVEEGNGEYYFHFYFPTSKPPTSEMEKLIEQLKLAKFEIKEDGYLYISPEEMGEYFYIDEDGFLVFKSPENINPLKIEDDELILTA